MLAHSAELLLYGLVSCICVSFHASSANFFLKESFSRCSTTQRNRSAPSGAPRTHSTTASLVQANTCPAAHAPILRPRHSRSECTPKNILNIPTSLQCARMRTSPLAQSRPLHARTHQPLVSPTMSAGSYADQPPRARPVASPPCPWLPTLHAHHAPNFQPACGAPLVLSRTRDGRVQYWARAGRQPASPYPPVLARYPAQFVHPTRVAPAPSYLLHARCQ